jgi:hypothetical protein
MGIAFVVVFFVAGFGIQAEPPDYDAPIAEVREYWVNDGDSYLIGDYLLGIAALVLLLPFLAALRALLGRAEGDAQLWSRVSFAGGVLLVAVASLASGPWTALAAEPELFSDDGLRVMMLLDLGMWHAFSYMMGTLVLAGSLVMVQTGVLWRWLGGLGIIVGIAAFVEGLWLLSPDSDFWEAFGFIPFIGFAVWLLLTGVAMFMKQTEPVPVVVRET